MIEGEIKLKMLLRHSGLDLDYNDINAKTELRLGFGSVECNSRLKIKLLKSVSYTSISTEILHTVGLRSREAHCKISVFYQVI